MGIQKKIDKFNDLCHQAGVALVLDARTEDGKLRMTSLEADFKCVMRNFQVWIIENSLKAEDIWYADLFESHEGKALTHIASLFVEPDGVSVRMEPAPENSNVVAFRRKPGLRRRLRNFKTQFSEYR